MEWLLIGWNLRSQQEKKKITLNSIEQQVKIIDCLIHTWGLQFKPISMFTPFDLHPFHIFQWWRMFHRTLPRCSFFAFLSFTFHFNNCRITVSHLLCGLWLFYSIVINDCILFAVSWKSERAEEKNNIAHTSLFYSHFCLWRIVPKFA